MIAFTSKRGIRPSALLNVRRTMRSCAQVVITFLARNQRTGNVAYLFREELRR